MAFFSICTKKEWFSTLLSRFVNKKTWCSEHKYYTWRISKEMCFLFPIDRFMLEFFWDKHLRECSSNKSILVFFVWKSYAFYWLLKSSKLILCYKLSILFYINRLFQWRVSNFWAFNWRYVNNLKNVRLPIHFYEIETYWFSFIFH